MKTVIFDDFLSSNKWFGLSNCCDLIPSPPLSAAGGSAPGYWLRELRSAGLQLREKELLLELGTANFALSPSRSFFLFANFAPVAVFLQCFAVGEQRAAVSLFSEINSWSLVSVAQKRLNLREDKL